MSEPEAYPFRLPLICKDFEVGFDRVVTIIIIGKSTLLEGIAAMAGYDAAGGAKGDRPVDHWQAREVMGGTLAKAPRASWLPNTADGWFFRAEQRNGVRRDTRDRARPIGHDRDTG